MKYCKTCAAYIAEPFAKCPLCQNELTGEDDMFIFPSVSSIRKKSVMFKIVMFALLIATIICLCLDFVLELSGDVHWSLIVTIWCLLGMAFFAPIFIRKYSVGEIVWRLGISGIVGSVCTTWYIDNLKLLFDLLLPIILMTLMVCEFIIILAEKYTGSMPYFVSAAFGTIMIVIVRLIAGYEQAVLMNVALSVAVVLTVLLFALKSERLIGDIKKKLSL